MQGGFGGFLPAPPRLLLQAYKHCRDKYKVDFVNVKEVYRDCVPDLLLLDKSHFFKLHPVDNNNIRIR